MLFHIFINRRKYDVEAERLPARSILALLGLVDGYDLFLLQGEGDPSGGRCLLADEEVPIKNGLHFRAQPGNCTFGDHNNQIPRLLGDHAAELSASLGCPVAMTRVGPQVLIVLEKVALPPGLYNVSHSDILLLTDFQYPASAMDMFFMEEAVTFPGGRVPDHATGIVDHLGRRWRQWSWHRNGRWTPGVDDLLSHWAFVEGCWDKEIRDASARAPR